MSRTPVRSAPGRPRFSDAALRVRGAAVPEGADSDPLGSQTRPASVWPASTRPAELDSASFVPTHFDPLLEQKARDARQAGAALDTCHAMLALRVVLGVQAIGPHVTDMITEATMAVQHRLTAEQVAATIHPHPTLSEAFHEAIEVALGHPLHI